MADVPVVMAVYLQYVEGARTVGIAYCDATGRKLGACQFTDDEHFCNLETVLVQLGAKECVLPKVGTSGLACNVGPSGNIARKLSLSNPKKPTLA